MISADAIRDGLVQGEFFLEYLPTVSLADGRCVGAEALTRWRRSSGVVQPDDFIPLIEGTHLSGMLTYWVFETVAKELGDWLRAHKEVGHRHQCPPRNPGAGRAGIRRPENRVIRNTESAHPRGNGARDSRQPGRRHPRGSVPVRRPDCSRRCDLERDQPRHPVTLHPGRDQDGPVARRPDHARMSQPGVAQRPVGVAPFNESGGHRRGSRNGGTGRGPASGRDSDGAGVLLFSTHFGRTIEGVPFHGGRPIGPIHSPQLTSDPSWANSGGRGHERDECR